MGAHPVSAELFDSPLTLSEQYQSIVAAAAMDAVDRPAEVTPSRRVRRFIELAMAVPLHHDAPAGAGTTFVGNGENASISLLRWQGDGSPACSIRVMNWCGPPSDGEVTQSHRRFHDSTQEDGPRVRNANLQNTTGWTACHQTDIVDGWDIYSSLTATSPNLPVTRSSYPATRTGGQLHRGGVCCLRDSGADRELNGFS
jgi:hypothetical protein